MHLRKGFPSIVEVARVRHRLACGEDLETIASSLGRRPEVLAKHLAKDPPVHPQQPNSALKITMPSGARIEGLSLNELIRLARAL
jgi:hypothetical protein